MQNILIIDSDEHTLTPRGDQLLLDGYEVATASTERHARHQLANAAPDAAVLATLGTPARTLALLRELRASEIPAADPRLPVLTVGAQDDHTAVRHYHAGANIALPAAASPLLISAGLRSLSQREQDRRIIRVGNLTIDTTARTATVDQTPLRLARLEFDLLSALATQPNRARSRTELIKDVWGYEPHTARSRAVDQAVSRLRTKLTAARVEPQVDNVHGVGYRLSK